MPLNNNAFVLPGTGTAYTAEVGTAAPTVINPPASPFIEIAHIGNNEGDGLPTWTTDGGDTSNKGSWQRKAIKTYTEPLSETIEFEFSQIDESTLRYYTGASGGNTPGQFQVFGKDIGTGVETAFLITFTDGTVTVGFYAPRVSISRNDDIELDPEEAARLPVKASLLDLDDDTPRYIWIAPWMNQSNGTGGGELPE